MRQEKEIKEETGMPKTERREKMDELKKISMPIIEYINRNYNPHTVIVISNETIKVMIAETGIPVKEINS